MLPRRFSVTFDLRNKEQVTNSAMQKSLNLMPTHVFVVPANVYQLSVVACGGGAAGEFPNLDKKSAGQGGAAGFAQRFVMETRPGKRYEMRVGNGGKYNGPQEPLTCLQVEQKVFEIIPPQDTIVYDCENSYIVIGGYAGKGFCGGLGQDRETIAQSGIGSYTNSGTGFRDANKKWIGYGGGGGGGRHGGNGGCVYSNKKSSKAADAEEYTGCGGGGSALVLGESSKHFLPGSGASGYVQIGYER